MTRLSAIVILALLTAPSFAAPQPPPTPAPAAATPTERAVYRLDFEVVTSEPGKPAETTAFTLNLEDHRSGEATIGDNIVLATGPNGGNARQNTGLRLDAMAVQQGKSVLLDVDTELSVPGANGALHKMSAKGVALAALGKKSLVASIDHDHTRMQVMVTPTQQP